MEVFSWLELICLMSFLKRLDIKLLIRFTFHVWLFGINNCIKEWFIIYFKLWILERLFNMIIGSINFNFFVKGCCLNSCTSRILDWIMGLSILWLELKHFMLQAFLRISLFNVIVYVVCTKQIFFLLTTMNALMMSKIWFSNHGSTALAFNHLLWLFPSMIKFCIYL